jgi:hypothetical protein
MPIIYKLECNKTGDIYIGSTITSLKERLRHHISDYKKNYKPCVSKYIIEKGDYNISVIEEINNNDNIELLKREQYWMDNIPNINVKRAYTTKEKKKEMNKKEWDKWYKNNKEKQREKAKDNYYENWEYNQIRNKNYKAYIRSWKVDGRGGFRNNNFLDIDLSIFE